MSGYIDLNDLMTVAGAGAGQVSISGWQPQGSPQLVTGARHMDELDSLDALGALSGAQPGAMQNAMLQQAMANKLAQSSLLVQQQRPTKARELILGFESPAPVAPGTTATITSRPQVPFRPERLVIPSDIAGSFSLLDLRVGKNSQFTNSGAVPARTFQENAVGIRLMLDTAQISQDITISLQNIGGASQTFRASMIGAAVE